MKNGETERKLASAVKYEESEGLPVLLAKGKGRQAEQIIAMAKDAGIEIIEEPALAALLESGVNPGEWIPPWCWDALAKILALVFSREKKSAW